MDKYFREAWQRKGYEPQVSCSSRSNVSVHKQERLGVLLKALWK